MNLELTSTTNKQPSALRAAKTKAAKGTKCAVRNSKARFLTPSVALPYQVDINVCSLCENTRVVQRLNNSSRGIRQLRATVYQQILLWRPRIYLLCIAVVNASPSCQDHLDGLRQDARTLSKSLCCQVCWNIVNRRQIIVLKRNVCINVKKLRFSAIVIWQNG